MNVLIIGSGGREHAICYAFSRSKKVKRLFCANGNAGIGQIAELVPVKPDDIEGLADFAKTNDIDLTFVGGETSLALGIVDEFDKRGLKIIGPNKNAARLEASKSFAKDFMQRHNIPTAAYKTAYSVTEALEILEAGEFGDTESPVVVKADGLAAGKGVVVARDRDEAIAAVKSMDSTVGAEASSKIVLEECLTGREVSLLMFCDGNDFALMPPTRDHKRIGDGDVGPNTGGMGAITDRSLLNEDQIKRIVREVIKPTLNGCREEGFPFAGVLFLGLMMTEAGPKVLEYNVRFGDPETQAILVRLKTDLVDICDAMLSGTLADLKIKWRKGSSACVILASAGYPQKARTGDVINGLDNASGHKKVTVFHSGTAVNNSGEFVTAGGRVLGVTARAKTLEKALKRAYKAVDDISWEGMQYRKDIGRT
jgi:phosphoribosylamine--glycine ligase